MKLRSGRTYGARRAGRVRSVKKKRQTVRKIVQSELHRSIPNRLDFVQFSTVNNVANGTLINHALCSQVDRGTQGNERTGNVINLRYWNIHGWIQMNSSVNGWARLLVVQCKDSNLSSTESTKILNLLAQQSDDVSGANLDDNDITDITSGINKLKFKLLYSKTWRFVGVGSVAADNLGKNFKTIKCGKRIKKKLKFLNSGTEGSQNTNVLPNIRMILITRSDDGNATDLRWKYKLQEHITYEEP